MCISFLGIFEHFWASFVHADGSHCHLCPNRAECEWPCSKPWTHFAALPNCSSFAPPAAPCPGLASLWLGRGSGGAPFCFPSVFLPIFPSSLLVRCSSRELRARAKWVPILAQACDSVIGTSRFRIVCARFPENQQSNLQALLSPSGAKPPDYKSIRVSSK